MKNLPILADIDFAREPLTEAWKGSLNHIGPVQTITPLVELLAGKTTCGTVTLMSGVTAWGAARLRPFTDVSFLDEMADAVFAWQADWRYLNGTGGPREPSPEQPVAISAAMTIRSLFINSINTPTEWHSFYQPLMKASHIVNIVQFILPKDAKKAFKTWLKETSDRLDIVAEIPDLEERKHTEFDSREAFYAYKAPRRGPPIPPLVLDPGIDLSNLDLVAEAHKFIATLDHTKNRYLKSPDQMIAEGFESLPYGKPT
jgi:hypothetical protein